MELNYQQKNFLHDFLKAQLEHVNSETSIKIINQIIDKLNQI